MGLSFRKSFKVGPVRLNLSRSGLGMSTGVKGFRVGVGPRGNYVQGGHDGVYFHQSLSAAKRGNKQPERPLLASDGMCEIESGNVEQMSDEQSSDLLNTLNQAQRRIQLFPLVLILAIITSPFLFPLLILVPLALYARHIDVTKGTVILTFETDTKAKKAFEEMARVFQDVMQCERIWHIEAEGKNADLKRSAGGAQTSVKRTVIRPSMGTPKIISSTIQVPVLKAGRQTLYFFPDRVLIFDRKKVGAVPYDTLMAAVSKTRFIESGSVPKDAEVVGTTWQYVNKSGGPDRRFANNRELYIALYGELALKSETGLNELFHTSTADPLHAFAAALQGMKDLGSSEAILPSLTVD